MIQSYFFNSLLYLYPTKMCTKSKHYLHQSGAFFKAIVHTKFVTNSTSKMCSSGKISIIYNVVLPQIAPKMCIFWNTKVVQIRCHIGTKKHKYLVWYYYYCLKVININKRCVLTLGLSSLQGVMRTSKIVLKMMRLLRMKKMQFLYRDLVFSFPLALTNYNSLHFTDRTYDLLTVLNKHVIGKNSTIPFINSLRVLLKLKQNKHNSMIFFLFYIS